MSFLEEIKNNLETHIDNIIFKIKKNNHSQKIEYNDADKYIHINLTELSSDEKKEFGQIIEMKVREEGKILLDEDDEILVKDIKFNERTPQNILLLNFFKDKIPNNDWDALRAATYIRKRFEDGTTMYKEVYKLKGDVIKKHGARGNNICNLCSAGYFENMLMPLYNEMMKLQFTCDDFLKRYNTIIEEEAFAIFVTYNMSISELQVLIEKKIRRNLNYGVKFVSIHGIGKKNVEKIKEVLPYLSIDHDNLRKIVEEMNTIINVKLWF